MQQQNKNHPWYLFEITQSEKVAFLYGLYLKNLKYQKISVNTTALSQPP